MQHLRFPMNSDFEGRPQRGPPERAMQGSGRFPQDHRAVIEWFAIHTVHHNAANFKQFGKPFIDGRRAIASVPDSGT